MRSTPFHHDHHHHDGASEPSKPSGAGHQLPEDGPIYLANAFSSHCDPDDGPITTLG